MGPKDITGKRTHKRACSALPCEGPPPPPLQMFGEQSGEGGQQVGPRASLRLLTFGV